MNSTSAEIFFRVRLCLVQPEEYGLQRQDTAQPAPWELFRDLREKNILWEVEGFGWCGVGCWTFDEGGRICGVGSGWVIE